MMFNVSTGTFSGAKYLPKACLEAIQKKKNPHRGKKKVMAITECVTTFVGVLPSQTYIALQSTPNLCSSTKHPKLI